MLSIKQGILINYITKLKIIKAGNVKNIKIVLIKIEKFHFRELQFSIVIIKNALL